MDGENNKKSPYEQLMWKNINKTKDKVEQSAFGSSEKFKWPPSCNASAADQEQLKTQIKSNCPQEMTSNNTPIKVKMYIGKKFRIYIKPSNKIVCTVLSKLKGSEYDLKSNSWSFDIEYTDQVCSDLTKNRIIFEKIPAGTLALARRSFKDDRYSLETGIYDLLMSFQKEAVNFAINRSGRVLLADDMGLGKTIQALAIANYYKIEFPLLIIAPSSLCHSWVDSIRQFLNEESTLIHERSDFGSRISVISYNISVNFIDTIILQKYSVIICDECHYLKSMTSKRTKLILPALQKSSRLVMISGTPATSRPLELYPIICALDKTLYPNFQVYGNRYCDGKKRGLYYDYKGCSNAEELSLVIEKAFMIRRTKDTVLNELPLKFRRQIFLKCPGKNRSFSKHADFVGDNPDGQIMQEYREAAGIKKDPVIKYLGNVLEKNIKCIVFAHHKEMLDNLEEFAKSGSYSYIRIDGSTISSKRHVLVESFQNDDRVRLAILSLTACCTGLTLTAAKAVIFAELYWNPGTMLQAEDRIHRIGQKDNIDIHYLVAENTIDEIVWPKLLKKLNVLESLGMSKNDLKTIKGTRENEGFQSVLPFKKA